MSFDTRKNNGQKWRLKYLQEAKRVVIKVGSAVLARDTGMNISVIENLVKDIAELHDSGRDVILVSSGAVAAGRQKIQFNSDSEISLKQKQALAAIGQSQLMHIYDSLFANFDKNIAQVLLTHADLAHRKRYLNFKNTILTLLKMGVIPIINENDTVSTEELQFGDNDNLGALVTNLIEGDIFLCLTDVDCLYTKNPAEDDSAQPVYTVVEVTEEVERMAGHSKSILGTGGMQSKILAAKKVASGGGASLIGPGKQPEIINHIFAGKMHGTFFLPRRKRLQGRKQWIAYVLKPKGKIQLDDGACQAVCSGGKSILPSGVVAVQGEFAAGESVQCVDGHGKVIAVGLPFYRAVDIQRIMGAKSDEIVKILGFSDSNVIIHRDNLVLL